MQETQETRVPFLGREDPLEKVAKWATVHGVTKSFGHDWVTKHAPT